MIKTHFNDAIIGNSKMLACLTSKGELIRLFWPHIDYPSISKEWQREYFTPVIKIVHRGLTGVIGTINNTMWNIPIF